MKRVMFLIAALAILFASAELSAQKIETVDGVRLVHNTGPGAWGKTPQVTLEPVRVLGDVDTADENLAFYIPVNIVRDPAGALLGSIPLDFFADGIFIYGDRLFLMDKYRGTQFREYKIKG